MNLNKKSTISWIKEFTVQHKSSYLLSINLAILGVLFSIAPYFIITDIIIDLLNDNKNLSIYAYKCTIIAMFWILRYLLHMSSTTISHKATFTVIAEVREKIVNKLVDLPLGYVIDTPSGKLKNIMVEKIDSIEPTLAHVVPEMTANIIGPILIIIYLFLIDWRMALSALITIPIGIICYMGMMKDYEKNYSNYVEKNKILNETAVEYIEGIKVIKAFNQSASSYEKFTEAAKEAAFSAINWMKKCNLYFSIAMGIFPAVLVGVLPIGCILHINGSLSADTFIMTIILALGILTPLITAMSYTDDIAKIKTIINDITSVLMEKEMIRPKQKKVINNFDIELKNVGFSYGCYGEKILKGISLKIAQGSINALVGPSGGGKSTIAKLIASLWDVDEGEITIGGISEKKIPLEQINEMIAYVSQDNYLFDDTIRNNIRMGKIDATDEEVEEVAKNSGCHEFIMNLENGYETVVGTSGGHLSGGERQRISIARAVLKDAPIVILDEATAYTDPENEALVQSSVARLIQGKTLIVIAHRLSTISDADKIFVIKDGQIEAEGTQDELLEKCKLYRDMWKAHIDVKDNIEDDHKNASTRGDIYDFNI